MKSFSKLDNAATREINNANQMAFYSLILALAFKRGYADASLEWYAGKYGLSKRTVIRTLNALEEDGWIARLTKPNNTTRIFPLDGDSKIIYPVKSPEMREALRIKYGSIQP